MAKVDWLHGISGNWNNAADWSTGTVPNGSSNVTIGAPGSYTVTINDAARADDLKISDPGATVEDTSTLDIGGSLTLTAGKFVLGAGGEIAGGTIHLLGGSLNGDGGTLKGVTVDGSFTVGYLDQFLVTDGLNLTGSNGSGPGSLAITGGVLDVIDSEILNGATLRFASGIDSGYLETGYYGATKASTVTFGSGFTIDQTSGTNYIANLPIKDGSYSDTVNDGAINVSEGTLEIKTTNTNVGDSRSGSFANAGTITISGGILELSNVDFINTGSVEVSGGDLILVQTNLALGVNGSDSDVATSGPGRVVLGNASTLTGTVNLSALNLVFETEEFNSGEELSGVTWEGALNLDPNDLIEVMGGLKLTGAGGVGTGTLNINSGLLQVTDTETLNNATLNFTVDSGAGGLEAGYYQAKPGTALTLGANFTINQTSSLGTNNLEIVDANASIVNEGTINVTNGSLNIGSLELGGTFVNAGTISVGATDGYGATLAVGIGSFTNTGTIAVVAGTIDLASANFENDGSIAITDGGELTLQTTLTLGPNGNAGDLTVSDGGRLMLEGGGVLSGTINPSLLNIQFAQGELSGATWEGTLNVAGYVDIADGLNVTGENGSGDGTINIGENSGITVSDTETLNNATLNFTSSNGFLASGLENAFSSSTLTLGGGFTIDQSQGTNSIRNSPSLYGVSNDVVNDGVIDVSSGTLELSDGAFTNTGDITVARGVFELYYLTNFDNSGRIDVSNGGELLFDLTSENSANGSVFAGGSYQVAGISSIELEDNTTITTLTAALTLDGPGATVQSENSTTNQQISLDSTLSDIAASGVLVLEGDRDMNAASAISDAGRLQLAGSNFTDAAGLTIFAGGSLHGYGIATSLITNNGLIEAAGGTLTVAGAVTGNGSMEIDSGATLAISSSASQEVSFAGVATLELGSPAEFSGSLNGLVAGDTIILEGLPGATNATVSNGDLVVTLANGSLLSYAVDGSTAGLGFSVMTGASGTDSVVTAYQTSPITGVTPSAMGFVSSLGTTEYSPAPISSSTMLGFEGSGTIVHVPVMHDPIPGFQGP